MAALAGSGAFPAFAAPPEFSWRHVPLYAHLGKTAGDLSPEEIRFLADHFPIATIEKAQALRQRGSTEAGAKAAIAQLKAANPNGHAFTYWNMLVDYDRMYRSLQQPLPPQWFFGPPLMRNSRPLWRRFDPSNADFRRWWIATATKLVAETGADGLFADGLPQIAAHPAQLAHQLGAAKAAAMITGAKEMLCGLKRALPKDSLLIVNGLRSVPGGWRDGGMDFIGCVSGAMVEEMAYAQNASAPQVVADIGVIRDAIAAHKILFVKGWPQAQPIDPSADTGTLKLEAQRNLDFPLAVFLIAAGEQTYFSYSWGFRSDDGWFQWYSQFNHELGPPRGPAKRDGWTFRREFQHASVWTDVSKRTARITWR